MSITIRKAERKDAQQMLKVYNKYVKRFVGPAARTEKQFKRMLGKKEHINWVAADDQNKIIGYVHAQVNKRINRGEFHEIIADPDRNIEQVAKPLVEKVNAAFTEKKVSAILAATIRNPIYEKLFPKLGFFESESTGVFMYGILDLRKFLNELSPVFADRLKRVKNWNGTAQIACEEHSLTLAKTDDYVQQIVWTNQPSDLKITVTRELLVKLIFGAIAAADARKTGQLKLDSSARPEKAAQLLEAIFPTTRFLLMDYW